MLSEGKGVRCTEEMVFGENGVLLESSREYPTFSDEGGTMIPGLHQKIRARYHSVSVGLKCNQLTAHEIYQQQVC